MERLQRGLGLVAGIAGAAGVAALAAASHAFEGSHLDTAGLILLFHAGTILTLTLPPYGRLPLRTLAALLMAIGMLLFSGDLALRAVTGARLFPMAAPTGGITLIVAWAIAGVAALLRR